LISRRPGSGRHLGAGDVRVGRSAARATAPAARRARSLQHPALGAGALVRRGSSRGRSAWESLRRRLGAGCRSRASSSLFGEGPGTGHRRSATAAGFRAPGGLRGHETVASVRSSRDPDRSPARRITSLDTASTQIPRQPRRAFRTGRLNETNRGMGPSRRKSLDRPFAVEQHPVPTR
jgi:hypothetical protein